MPWAPIAPIGVGAGAAAGADLNQQQQNRQTDFVAQLLMHMQQMQQQREATAAYRDAMMADRQQRTAATLQGRNQQVVNQIPQGTDLPTSAVQGLGDAAIGRFSPLNTLPSQQTSGLTSLPTGAVSRITGPSTSGTGTTGETQVQTMSSPPQPTGMSRKLPSDTELERESRDRATQAQQAQTNAFRQIALNQGQQRVDQGQQRIDLNVSGSRAEDARLDRSYQYNATQLATLRKSYSDRTERLGRLQDSINQGNAASDALIGPELLSVAAGGQGSGLRMNEAEISRIVGGRSNWETLRAKLQMWNVDPKAARSLTPEQTTQIQGLVNAITKRNADGLAVLDKAGDDLVNAGSVNEHRQIVNNARKALTQSQTPTQGQKPTADDLIKKYAGQQQP